MNRKRIVSLAAAAAGFAVTTLAVAPSARAADEDFGEHGIMIGADRLLPILNYDSAKTDNGNGGSTTDSRVGFAFGSNGAGTLLESFYNLPRLGFDVVVIPHLTLGGSAWIYTDLSANTTTTQTNGNSTTVDQAKITYWGFSPRVGYVIPFSHTFHFWPRAGISYNNLGTGSVTVDNVTTAGNTTWQVAATVEAMFVITPWTRHFGFTVGPTADIPIAGKTSSTTTGTNGVTTTTSVNETMWQVGLQAGLVGHF